MIYLLHFQHDKSSTEEETEIEKIKHKLQEKEELISCLQAQLSQTQLEQTTQVGVLSHLIVIRLMNH